MGSTKLLGRKPRLHQSDKENKNQEHGYEDCDIWQAARALSSVANQDGIASDKCFDVNRYTEVFEQLSLSRFSLVWGNALRSRRWEEQACDLHFQNTEKP